MNKHLIMALLLMGSAVGRCVPGAAQENKGQLIATVDMQRVFSDNWKSFQVADAGVKAQQMKYKAIMQDLLPDAPDAVAPPLDTPAITVWLHLKEQEQLHPDALSAAERQQLKDYEAQGRTANTRLQTLENKYPNLTAPEQTELDKLHGQRQQAQQAINVQAQHYGEQLQDQFKTLQDKMEIQVQAALKQVCAERHISYVFNAAFVGSQGDLQKSLLFASANNADITPFVLNALNK